MDKRTVFLFGEAEKGETGKPILCSSLEHLFNHLGNAPEESLGIAYAIQFLSYNYPLSFLRVREEGFSVDDYLKGFNLLKKKGTVESLCAICLPGVGTSEIIDAITPLCLARKVPLILSEKDLYDYLTQTDS